ncbi:DUF262 domain-containing protein [Halomonas alkalicola]|uniref:DUF262 domain-containing protein n=1 Tax=Halomonas alkalicola TaxID=1930622 RepID=A0ABY9H5R0_9GAMM|nr:DUF262 domain-containing protein [Halomonas alkalicola]WLI73630.1 DUF262 domain-containing protein [Halomonas alkalicola]
MSQSCISSNSQLGASLTSLPQIFRGRFFAIPDYQRGFAWGERQARDLIEDIQQLMASRDLAFHFTGTLVVSWNEHTKRLDIVDGQQRLTSLIIFLSEIRNRLDGSQNKDRLKQVYLTRGGFGNESPVLLVGEAFRDYFERLVLRGEPVDRESFKTHKNIKTVRDTFATFLDKKLSEQAGSAQRQAWLCDWLEILESRLGFLVYQPDSNAEVGVMFEVINNRGKHLSELEKIKNYLIYVCVKLNANRVREDVNKRWVYILSYLHEAGKTSLQDESGFLRAVAIAFFRLNKRQASDIYSHLRYKALRLSDLVSGTVESDKSLKKIESFIEFMERAAKWYRNLYSRPSFSVENSKLNEYLGRLRAQDNHANIMPLFLALAVTKEKEQEIDDLADLLHFIEVFNFRTYIVPHGYYSTWLQGPLYTLAHQYLWWLNDAEENGDKDSPGLRKRRDDSMIKVLINESMINGKITDGLIDQRLFGKSREESFDFGGWNGIKYFLMCYEAFRRQSKTTRIDDILQKRRDGKTGDYLSLEHILATKYVVEGQSSEEVSYQKRRLGNFMLLEMDMNVRGGNQSIKDKMEAYENGPEGKNIPGSELAQVKEVIGLYEECFNFHEDHLEDFDFHVCLADRREDEFKNFWRQEWSFNPWFSRTKTNSRL